MKFAAFVFLLLALPVAGVTIYGTVFDASLSPTAAIVEINYPRQVAVAPNGTYNFTVEPNSNYTLIAKSSGEVQYSESAEISVKSEDLRFDFVLLTPSGLDDEIGDITETTSAVSDADTLPDKSLLYSSIAILILLVIGAAFLALKKQKESPALTEVPKLETPGVNLSNSENRVEEKKESISMNEFKNKIIQVLKEKGGAAEQKELRRELPWSEARVSIELSELEKLGKVKKIKKGRANLVKLI